MPQEEERPVVTLLKGSLLVSLRQVECQAQHAETRRIIAGLVEQNSASCPGVPLADL
jgi:hypothetical protein